MLHRLHCACASLHVISKAGGLREHMDTDRWAQSDTRHLGNSLLVGTPLAVLLDPLWGPQLLNETPDRVNIKQQQQQNLCVAESAENIRAGASLIGHIPVFLCKLS